MLVGDILNQPLKLFAVQLLRVNIFDAIQIYQFVGDVTNVIVVHRLEHRKVDFVLFRPVFWFFG